MTESRALELISRQDGKTFACPRIWCVLALQKVCVLFLTTFSIKTFPLSDRYQLTLLSQVFSRISLLTPLYYIFHSDENNKISKYGAVLCMRSMFLSAHIRYTSKSSFE